jgi:hypothetical protein
MLQDGRELRVKCSFEVRRSHADGAEYWEGRFVHPRTSHGIGRGDAILRLPSGSESRISINQIDTRAPCTGFFKGIGSAPPSSTTVSQNAVSQWPMARDSHVTNVKSQARQGFQRIS